MSNPATVTPLPKASRGPRHTFTLPDSARAFKTDPASITLVPLTMEQDLDGSKVVAKSNNIYDKVKMALVAVDGKAVDWGKGETDQALSGMSPKARELVLAAYMSIHSSKPEVLDDFLASVSVEL